MAHSRELLQALEHLEYPWWSSGIWGPGAAVAQEGVGEDQELAHDRGERDLGCFAGGAQSLVLGLNHGVEADGNERRHVERLAQRSTAATDEALGAALDGVARHRREAGEARGASVLEGAKLGHLDQHGQRGGLADAGDADQDVEAGLQGGIGGERRVQGSVDRGELALDLAQTRSDLTLEQRRAVRVVAVVVNVTAADASSFRASQGQIAADMARAIDRASRNR